jgi:hypothetical protein
MKAKIQNLRKKNAYIPSSTADLISGKTLEELFVEHSENISKSNHSFNECEQKGVLTKIKINNQNKFI